MKMHGVEVKKKTPGPLPMDSQTNIHILIDKRSVLDMPFFMGAAYGTDHHLAVAKVRERFAVSKQRAQNFDMGRFNLRRLSELEFRKQYQIKISNRFSALRN